jgi:flagellar basal body-associated protein FliL
MNLQPLRAILLVVMVLSYSSLHIPPAFASGGGHGGGASKEEAKKDAKAKKKEAVTITGGLTSDDPIFLHMAPITLPVINDYGAQQIVTMLVDLHMNDLENAQKMQKEMPRIKDAIMQAL